MFGLLCIEKERGRESKRLLLLYDAMLGFVHSFSQMAKIVMTAAELHCAVWQVARLALGNYRVCSLCSRIRVDGIALRTFEDPATCRVSESCFTYIKTRPVDLHDVVRVWACRRGAMTTRLPVKYTFSESIM